MSEYRYRLGHLAHMSDGTGLFEHARVDQPRLEHGYCTDDNARLLLVMSREADSGEASELARLALRFVRESQDASGGVRNRRSARTGRWTDQPGTGDWWGRALWGLGSAAASHPDPLVRWAADEGFRVAARERSPFLHAMAFASLGAADLLIAFPGHGPAREVLESARSMLIGEELSAAWPWPRLRLTYASAAIAEAMIATGLALRDQPLLDRGLRSLDWLIALQADSGWLSVVGTGGRGPGDRGPQFDQQPIEVAALADACWRAWLATGDPAWLFEIERAADWFEGRNDLGIVMHDHGTGGGFDGLTPDGPNRNQGAESTLAFISTMQRARSARPLTAARE